MTNNFYTVEKADAEHLPLEDKSVDLVFGSPPYAAQRTYGEGDAMSRNPADWIQWMLRVTKEATRVCRGPVFWVIAGAQKNFAYQPYCEGLIYEWWKLGGNHQLYAPCFWHRNGIAGSGGKDYFAKTIEYVMCFKPPGQLPYSDNTACGHAPMFRGGGNPTSRKRDGQRMGDRPYKPPTIANPGNLISTGAAGGGHLGSKLAHSNEAPFPEALVERFVLSFCPVDGVTCDPFCGSGTTLAVAKKWRRSGIGYDLRESQVELTKKRLAIVTPVFPSVVEPKNSNVTQTNFLTTPIYENVHSYHGIDLSDI